MHRTLDIIKDREEQSQDFASRSLQAESFSEKLHSVALSFWLCCVFFFTTCTRSPILSRFYTSVTHPNQCLWRSCHVRKRVVNIHTDMEPERNEQHTNSIVLHAKIPGHVDGTARTAAAPYQQTLKQYEREAVKCACQHLYFSKHDKPFKPGRI